MLCGLSHSSMPRAPHGGLHRRIRTIARECRENLDCTSCFGEPLRGLPRRAQNRCDGGAVTIRNQFIGLGFVAGAAVETAREGMRGTGDGLQARLTHGFGPRERRSVLHAFEYIAALCAALFAGAALSITLAEHPARMGLETGVGLPRSRAIPRSMTETGHTPPRLPAAHRCSRGETGTLAAAIVPI